MIEELLKSIKANKIDILMLERGREKACEPFNSQIKEFTENIEQAELLLEVELKDSGEKKIETKLGNATFKKQPDKWYYDEDKVRKWIGTFTLEDGAKFKERYFKIEEILKKQVLKDDVIKGDEIPGVAHEPQEDKFTYTLKGGVL